MGLFDRIYHQGHGERVYAPPPSPTDWREVHVGAEEAPRPAAPPPAPVRREEGTSPFAWGVLAVVGLFGAGYLARAFQKPPAPAKEEEE